MSADIVDRQAGSGATPRTVLSSADDAIRGILVEPAGMSDALVVCVHGSGCNGAYFDLSCNSFVQQAITRRLSVLLVDRPGHGISPAPPQGPAIAAGATAIGTLIDAVRATRADLARHPVALVGHSFGGAVAMTLAARRSDLPIATVCVSGIGDRANAAYAAADRGRDPVRGATPAPYWLFGPGNTYDWRGVTALRAATDHWRAEEVAEIVETWPARWASVAAAITCPVHIRLAEHERIWDADAATIARMTASFPGAPRVDAAIALAGGHLYEVHLRGPELVAAQVAFIRDNAIGPAGVR